MLALAAAALEADPSGDDKDPATRVDGEALGALIADDAAPTLS